MEFELDHLDIDAAEQSVAQQLEEEAAKPATEAVNECEGGACTI